MNDDVRCIMRALSVMCFASTVLAIVYSGSTDDPTPLGFVLFALVAGVITGCASEES